MDAPAFELEDQHGTLRKLSDFAGKWVVLYFYPKDDTPACTKEACSFSDGRTLLQSMGAEVIGISADSVKSHQKFAQKHALDIVLLSDPTHATIEAFGSWKPKKFMGREFIGIHRDTYLINPQGKIVKKYEGVDVAVHFGEVVEDLKRLQA